MPNLTCLFGHDYRNEGGPDRILWVCFRCGKFLAPQQKRGNTMRPLTDATDRVNSAVEKNGEIAELIGSAKEVLEEIAVALAEGIGTEGETYQALAEAKERAEQVMTYIAGLGTELETLEQTLAAISSS